MRPAECPRAKESILASLRGDANAAIISAATASLQVLATQTHTKIEITTAGSHVTLRTGVPG